MHFVLQAQHLHFNQTLYYQQSTLEFPIKFNSNFVSTFHLILIIHSIRTICEFLSFPNFINIASSHSNLVLLKENLRHLWQTICLINKILAVCFYILHQLLKKSDRRNQYKT